MWCAYLPNDDHKTRWKGKHASGKASDAPFSALGFDDHVGPVHHRPSCPENHRCSMRTAFSYLVMSKKTRWKGKHAFAKAMRCTFQGIAWHGFKVQQLVVALTRYVSNFLRYTPVVCQGVGCTPFMCTISVEGEPLAWPPNSRPLGSVQIACCSPYQARCY